MTKNTLKEYVITTYLVIFTTLIFLFSAKNCFANNILLFENFDNGKTADWEEIIGDEGYWRIVYDKKDGYYEGSVVKIGPDNPSYSFAGDVNWTNYIYEISSRGLEGVDRYLVFRYDPNRIGSKGYCFKYHDNYANGLIELSKCWGNGALQTGIFLSNLNEEHKFKINVLDSNIKIFVDNNLNPIIDFTDKNDPFLNGKIGMMIWPGYYNGPGSRTTVAFDDIKVTDIPAISTFNLFNLPITYTNRGTSSESTTFKPAFWLSITAAFDHTRKGGIYIPFTGNEYKQKDCVNGVLGITCYDSHNGVDFWSSDKNVYSVADGKVIFTSDKNEQNEKCKPSKGGYGCVIIVEYPGNYYGLYAHLDEIGVYKDKPVTENEIIGKMGKTGCGRCGTHLHFSVLRSKNIAPKIMTDSDWQEVLFNMMPTAETAASDNEKLAFCSYVAPNGNLYYFVDPSGWKDIIHDDPWTFSVKDKGCGITSDYLWKYEVGTSE